MTDHPHVRGEKAYSGRKSADRDGSSPRAWGKAQRACECADRDRIIPTCVGKSCNTYRAGIRRSDHPHVRGEKTRLFRGGVGHNGSSPRAWGKVAREVNRHDVTRIIPTCVGKRAAQDEKVTVRADHPHVRGEKSCSQFCPFSLSGSSPRAWGKVVGDVHGSLLLRIIPTCVGKSSLFCS